MSGEKFWNWLQGVWMVPSILTWILFEILLCVHSVVKDHTLLTNASGKFSPPPTIRMSIIIVIFPCLLCLKYR